MKNTLQSFLFKEGKTKDFATYVVPLVTSDTKRNLFIEKIIALNKLSCHNILVYYEVHLWYVEAPSVLQ